MTPAPTTCSTRPPVRLRSIRKAAPVPSIAIAQCAADGSFTLSGIPAGSYELAVWDQWLDQIIQTQAVTVGGTSPTVALGNIPVLSWFTQHDQNVFMDLNHNGVLTPGEPGIPNR